MKLAVVANDIGKSVGGLVIDALLKELTTDKKDIFIICNESNNADFNGCRVIEIKKKIPQETLFGKILFILCGIKITDSIWSRNALEVVKNDILSFKPDILLSIIGATSANRILLLSNSLIALSNCKYAVHFLDAIPSPRGWGENKFLRNQLKRTLRNYLKKADLLTATNTSMLNYQRNILNLDKRIKSCVVFNPGILTTGHENASTGNSLLFLGSVYTKRNPQNLINAFIMVLEQYPELKLVFVGKVDGIDLIVPLKYKENIIFREWTDDPQSYIKEARVLVDIDAEIKDDVFISSKLINYIYFNKPILLISSIGSPSRKLLLGLKRTVFISDHNESNIKNTLLDLLNQKISSGEYSEREPLRKKLTARSVTAELYSCLSSLLNSTV